MDKSDPNTLNSKQQYLMVGLAWVALQMPAINVLFRYIPKDWYWLMFVFWIVSFLVYRWLVLANNPRNFVHTLGNSVIVTIVILILMAAINAYWYPIADARKAYMSGSDQDDALILVIKALFSGDSPYAVRTYLGNYPSPGPGLILLLAPFVLLDVYFLITPFFLGLICFALYQTTKSWVTSNIFLLLLCFSPAFWKLMLNGSDLIVVGLLMVLPVLVWPQIKDVRLKWLLGGFLAMVLTSRIIFVYLAPLYTFFLHKREDGLKKWIVSSIILSIATVAFHGVFVAIDPENYAPIHLLFKGQRILTGPILSLLCVLIPLSVWYTYKMKESRLENLYHLWYWLFIVLVVIIIGETSFEGNSLLTNSLTHLGVQIPVFAAYLSLALTGHSINKVFDKG